MDKYEFNIKVDQIKKRIEEGDYKTALKIADAIDWMRVRNQNLLSMAADVYEKNGRYDDAKDILLMAFERAPVGKRLLYKLCELSVISGDLEEAEDYYNEFLDVAPEDVSSHILAYMILKAAGAPYDRLITELQAYVTAEPDERWLYELASVYDEAGYGNECVAICDRIVLLFGSGRYTEQAVKLKEKYQPAKDRRSAAGAALTSEVDLRSAEEIGDELAAIRYENEDEAFEEYLRAHESEMAVVVSTSLEKETELSNDEELSDEFSEEVKKLSNDIKAEASAPVAAKSRALAEAVDPEDEKTQIFDGERLTELRNVIIKAGTVAEKVASRNAKAAIGDAVKQAAGIAESAKAASISVESVRPVPAPGLSKEDIAPLVETAEKKTEAETMPDVPRTEARPAFSAEEKEPTAPKAKDPEAAEKETLEAVAAETPAREQPPFEKKEPKHYHMVIEAEDDESGFDIAKDELRTIHREQGLTNAALKTTAEKLNERGFTRATIEKLRGKDLIIEHAGQLSKELLDALYKLMKEDTSGMIAVLIDMPEGLDEIEEKKPEIFEICDLVSDFEDEYEDESDTEVEPYHDESEYDEDAEEDIDDESGDFDDDDYDFDERDEDTDDESYGDRANDEIDEDDDEEIKALGDDKTSRRSRAAKKQAGTEIHHNINAPVPESADEQMDIDDFAQYCCQYAADIDCSITGKSMLALYERIELMEEDNIPLTKKNAVRLIEGAADHAERPPIGQRIKGIFGSKYDKNGLLILKEEDFIY